MGEVQDELDRGALYTGEARITPEMAERDLVRAFMAGHSSKSGVRFGICADVHCQRRGPLKLEAYAADGSELWCCAWGCGELHSGIRGLNRTTPARGYQIRLWLGAGGSGWVQLLTTLGHAAGCVEPDAFQVDTSQSGAPLP